MSSTHNALCAYSLGHVWLCDPVDCILPGSSVHGDSPGKNPGVGGHTLLQEIFPTQISNPGLPHGKQILHNKGSGKKNNMILSRKEWL